MKCKLFICVSIIVMAFVAACSNPFFPEKKEKEQEQEQRDLQDHIEFAVASVTKIYGDPVFTVAVNANYKGTGSVIYSSSDADVAVVNESNGEVTIKSAGETIITAVKAADERYAKSQASYTLIVNKAELTVSAENKIINFNDEPPEYTYTITGFVYDDTRETTVTGTPVLSCDYVRGSEAGSYAILITQGTLSASNYDFIFVNGALSVGLANQSILTITNPGVKTYGDAAFTLSTTGGSGTGDVSYSIVSGGDVIGITGDTVTIIKAGTAEVKAVKAADANYNHVKSLPISITVGKRSLTNATVSAGGTPVYTGHAHTPVPVVTDNDLVTASDYTVSYDNNVNAGIATITITATDSGNYTGTQSGSFTIGKATLTVIADSFTIAYRAAAPEYTYSITGFVSGEDQTVVSGEAELMCEYVQNDPKGVYPITFETENLTADNYIFIYEDGELIVGFPEQNTLSISNGDITKTYGDEPFTLTTEGGSGTGAVSFRVITGSDVIGINSTSAEVFIKRAGTATVAARKAGDENYSRALSEAVTITVDKRNLSHALVTVNGTFTYTGYAHTPTPSVTDGGLITASDWTISQHDNNVNAGTASVTITATDDGNYIGTQSWSFIICRKTITITGVTAADRMYDSTTTVTITGGILSGVVDGDDVTPVVPETGTIANANAGNLKQVIISEITLIGDDADNYTLTQPDVTVNITKADPTVTFPTNLTAVFGQTLSDVSLPGNGTGSPTGSFAWVSPMTSVGNAGAHTHNLRFTPTDTANFNTLTQIVTVTVNKADPVVTFPTSLAIGIRQQILSNDWYMRNVNGTPGIFVWAVPGTESINGEKYLMKFTPEDTDNYNESEEAVHVVIVPDITAGMEMVWIPAGTFRMGSPTTEPNRSTDENFRTANDGDVTLTQSFYMGKYQVTQEQYFAVTGTNPSSFSSNPASEEIQGNRPVERVTWFDAIEFCNKLSELEGLTPVYTITGRTPESGYPITAATVNANWDNNGYRLPTEAQWEYACRAGTQTRWHSGEDESLLGNYAWFSGNSGNRTHQVGLKLPNAWGLYDMHGNVREWCWDWFVASYSNAGGNVDPTGASSGSDRVFRGGGWYGSGRVLRSACRFRFSPDGRSDDLGFRVLRP